MSHPIFISFYTDSPYYRDCSIKLHDQISSLGGELLYEKIGDTGKYWKNTLLKPGFILDKMLSLKSDLIWIDADTSIAVYPECMKKWDSDIILASHTGTLEGIKASPIGLKYNERVIEFVKSWAKSSVSKIETNELDMDHDVMKYEILPEFKDRISIELMKCVYEFVDFTNGRVIQNGISRSVNKGNDVRVITDKNRKRDSIFNSLSLDNFKNG
jgi:hypothetical protein